MMQGFRVHAWPKLLGEGDGGSVWTPTSTVRGRQQDAEEEQTEDSDPDSGCQSSAISFFHFQTFCK